MRLRVGTRRSRLARTQTTQACDLLVAMRAEVDCELVFLDTSGDRVQDRPLRESGGKGLFVKELDEALLGGDIDCAVHSLKDVPSQLPDGLVLAAVLERHDPRDLLLSLAGWSPSALPAGARVGTTSLRRASQLLACNPRVRVEMLRGNVETRVRRVVEGDFDATFLAAAGLGRLGIDVAPLRQVALDARDFVPAPGQGALCFTAREGDDEVGAVLACLDDELSHAVAVCERGLARALGASCYLPVGAYAEVKGADVALDAVVASEDGQRLLRRAGRAPLGEAEALGARVGRELLEGGARVLLDEILARLEKPS